MDFDEMFEAWRAQNTAPPFDVNRDALRQALHSEEARFQREMRTRRRGIWIAGIVGTGMAIWAGFWIAITITNGWPSIYAITSGLCLALFAVGAGALWAGRGRPADIERNFGNTLQAELRRGLALIDYRLSLITRWILPLVGTVAIVAGSMLFSWTLTRSQDIRDQSGGGWWTVFLVIFFVLIFSKAHKERRKAENKLELRRRRLRELLAALEPRE